MPALPIAPNLLNRNFTVAAPNLAWSGDITYIPTEEGWLFLAVVIDLFSRKVVGWSMQPDMRRNLVIDTLEMAWFQRRAESTTKLIFHSDRGGQYASHEFRAVLEQHGIRASMSRKGNCWDNAPTETLFGSMKVERLHGQRFSTIRQAKDRCLPVRDASERSLPVAARIREAAKNLSPGQTPRSYLQMPTGPYSPFPVASF